MPRIDVPGQGIVDFPDSMSDDQIIAAIKSVSAPAQPQAPAKRTPESVAAGVVQGIRDLPQNLMSDIDKGANYAGGLATDLTGSPGVGTAVNTAIQALPMAVGAPIGQMVQKPVNAFSKWLMQSAVKPGAAALRKGQGDRAVQTLLDEGITVSRGGADKLRGLGEEQNRLAAAELAKYPNAQISKNAVASRLGDTERKFQAQVNPQADLAAIEGVDTSFLMHPQLAGRPTMPLQLAQELKQGTQRQLREKYGEMGAASTEAQKALARGLREEIERVAPGVGPTNERASDFWNALRVVEPRALQAGNNNIGGLVPLASVAHPGAGAAMMLDRSAAAKSLLARALYSRTNAMPKNAGRIIAGALSVDENGGQ